MGLRNSAQCFQRFITHILDYVPGLFTYLDNILVFSKTESEHLATLRELFSRLKTHGLPISLDKCKFGVQQLDFLGYSVNRHGITPLPRKIDCISAFPTPTKPKQLLGFLGAIGYYRRTLPELDGENAAQILQPLYEAATKEIPGKTFAEIWQELKLDKQFEKAKNLLKLAMQLNHPDWLHQSH